MNTATSPSCHAQIQPLLKSRTTKLRWGFYVVQMAWQQVCRGKLSNPWHVLTVSREWGCQRTWIVARGLPCSLAGQSAPTAPGGVLLFPHPSLSGGSHTTEPGYSHWQCHGLGMLAESEHEWMWVSVCTYKPLVSTINDRALFPTAHIFMNSAHATFMGAPLPQCSLFRGQTYAASTQGQSPLAILLIIFMTT